jgi:hypothetical protein
MSNMSTAPGPAAQPFNGTPDAFKERCYTFLNILCNDKDMKKAAEFLDPDCILIHEDHDSVHGAQAFIDTWKANLDRMPNYHKDIKDMIVEFLPGDEGMARIWVYSRISGITEGSLTDSIDMMRFTPKGLFLQSKDVQRTIKQS